MANSVSHNSFVKFKIDIMPEKSLDNIVLENK